MYRGKGQRQISVSRCRFQGQTIDFLLTAKRDKAAAKRFLRNAIEASGNAIPRVTNVDRNPAYPAAVEALKADGVIPCGFRRCGWTVPTRCE
jgi:transposase-like protein